MPTLPCGLAYMTILFLPVLYLCIISSYTDLKFGKIRNMDLLYAGASSVVISASLFLFFPEAGFLGKDFLFILFNAVVSLVVGYLLWLYGFWTAGDAKLYFIFSLILSPFIPDKSPFYSFPFISLLIFSFVPFFVFFLGTVIFNSRNPDYSSAVKKTFSPIRLASAIFSVFVILWLFQLLKLLPESTSRLVGTNPTVTFIIFFVAYFAIEKAFGRWALHAVVVISILRLLFDRSIYSFDFLSSFSVYLIMLVLMVFLRNFIFGSGIRLYSKKVKIMNLKPGMVMSDSIFVHERKKGELIYAKQDKLSPKIYSEKATAPVDAGLFERRPEGITASEIKKLNKLFKERKLQFSSLMVKATMPFAPFISFAALATVLLAFI